MLRASTGEVCDYQQGDWRTGEVKHEHRPRLLAPNHQMLAVPGGASIKKVEPAMTALDREVYDYSSEGPAAGIQARVPLLVVRPAASQAHRRTLGADRRAPGEVKSSAREWVRRPALIFCHDIGQAKEEMLPRMEAAARRGYVILPGTM
jgi:hypothetical protein